MNKLLKCSLCSNTYNETDLDTVQEDTGMGLCDTCVDKLTLELNPERSTFITPREWLTQMSHITMMNPRQRQN